jgi:DNA-binding FadR family transcriptional regulator
VEAAFWYEAVEKLTEEDKQELCALVKRAMEKLNGETIQVPHEEHRDLHLLIYRRLDNPFVTGILEAYWDAYESVGLNVFVGDLRYLLQVWEYHNQIAEAICSGDYKSGYEALVAHTDLLYQRS